MTCWDLRLLLTGLLTAGTCCAFKAAVYEHVLLGDPANESFEALVAKNLDSYVQAVRAAAAQGCDIIVFPEKGLMLGLDDRQKLSMHAEDIPDVGASPCLEGGDLAPVLAALSCLARDNRIYVVANVYDHKPCPTGRTSCPPDGVLFYNTNVAFGRDGTLVSRYHKNHLFREVLLDTPEPFEEAVFETDFGARVGMFICFDVLFPEAAQLVARHNITLAVMSTFWYDTLPGIYSVAVQQAWSLVHGVPLLAAGVQRPLTGTLGSGIYAGGRGPLIYSYSPDNRSKLLIANTEAAAPENPR
ncbi:vascular non-inflammatory molecule 2 [Ixodes scapularis]|uniref:vascular non-inflammatory molecule 2 n=1 Tax=Ixodes scapularis TaxID=6945 RepID=UPI001C391013|nr:vascular non-inflammatory molecule 2 [Ixodes scapularis]